jgi:8-oxo-dGTP pyrophosphatase MutT (NUDIX family)
MPVTPVPAATVILLRDGPLSPQVLMIKRHARSEFLPDMYVFPGGRVDFQDSNLSDRIEGLTQRSAEALLTTVEPEHALAYVVAAIRETFEESGILLARRMGEQALVDAEHTQALSPHRLAIQQGDTPFRELIERENLVLAADCLAAHGHWITPEMAARRFDTFFFAALAPPGQIATHDGVETTNHVWIRPEDALEEAERGERQIIFPTRCTLETLVGFENAEQALGGCRGRPLMPVMPVLVEQDGERVLAIPEEAGYPTCWQRVGGEPV